MTNIRVIYNIFLSKITDYRILRMSEEEIENNLFDYYEYARAIFYKCKNDLTTVRVGEDIFINSDLTPYEIQIIVSLMLVEYITPHLISSEKMQQTLNDKDFKIFSQANQLREVRLLLENMESRATKMITQYTYMDMLKGDKND